MGFAAEGNRLRAAATWIALVVLAACTTYVPLADDYAGPDALPIGGPTAFPALPELPPAVTGDIEARERCALRRAADVASVGRGLLAIDRLRVLRRRRRRAHSGRRAAAGLQRSARDPAFFRALLREPGVGGRCRPSRPRAARYARCACGDGARQLAGLSTRARLGRERARARCLADRRVRREPGRDGRGDADRSRWARELARDRHGGRRPVVSVGQHELSARRANDRRPGSESRHESRSARRQARCRDRARSARARAVRRRRARAHDHHAHGCHHSVRSAAAAANGHGISRNHVPHDRPQDLGGVLPETAQRRVRVLRAALRCSSKSR